MKTKTSLLAAFVALAGTASLTAQVYSLNIVGYVNQSIPAGFSIVANQLVNSTDNKVSTIFSSPPDQTTIYKFNPATGGYIINQYFEGAGWFGDDENMTLEPGEAAFISTSTAFVNTLVGEVKLNSTNAIPSGFSLKSSVLPQAGSLSGNLGFPLVDQLTVYKYNTASGGYFVDQYFDGAGWFGDNTSGDLNGPSVAVGEGFFVSSPTAADWTRNFSVQ